MSKIGICYMGSKRKLAKPIIDYILKHNPNTKYFYDLFGGGGAMSFEALQRKQIKEVHYNEFNTGVVDLLKKIRNDGVTPEFYEWIDRETFNEYKDKNCWKAGLIKTCWSFGNNQKDYMFSPENEYIKKILHNIIVYKDEYSILQFKKEYNIDIISELLLSNDIQQRRLDVMNYIKGIDKNRLDLQQLEGLQQLERLERLEQLQQLEITNQSYEDVIINTPIDETIIYLDPPYNKTAKYQKEIDYDVLYEYIRNSPYKIYISSYDFPFNLVKSFRHRSILSASANNLVTENLYCNKEDINFNDLF